MILIVMEDKGRLRNLRKEGNQLVEDLLERMNLQDDEVEDLI